MQCETDQSVQVGQLVHYEPGQSVQIGQLVHCEIKKFDAFSCLICQPLQFVS